MSYPSIAICQLQTQKIQNDLFNIDRLEDYIPQNALVHKTHAHDFYHFAFITSGTGSHIIDFVNIDASAHTLYFMKPHQVHSWNFNADIKGFVVNFSATFLDSNFIHSAILHILPFFGYQPQPEIYNLDGTTSELVHKQLESLYLAQKESNPYKHPLIAQQLVGFLLQLASRLTEVTPALTQERNYELLLQFTQLLEQKYPVWKHPKEYAMALHVTPQYLQTVVKHYMHLSTGDVIRERILLEAKRLLVSKKQHISEVAYQLGFTDNSYFSKFFKKYTHLSPEQFRLQF